jgi:hypothetical protein
MHGYFTVDDLVILLPMALAGALVLGMLPVTSAFAANMLRVLGALLGLVFAVVLVEGLPLLA